MLFRGVAFVSLQAVLEAGYLVQMRHEVVAKHLGHVGGSSDRLTLRIALDHAHLLQPQVGNFLVAIHQYHGVLQLVLANHPLDCLPHGIEGCL